MPIFWPAIFKHDRGAPGRLSSHDVARAIDAGEKVKLRFFDHDPYPGECDFVGIAPPGGFPFGGRRRTLTHPPPNVWRGLTSPPPNVWRGTTLMGSQTVAAKRRSVMTQTTPPTMPTEGRPVRICRLLSSFKEYETR